MTAPRSRRVWPILVAYWAVAALLRARGYMGLTGDDLLRILMTDHWARHPYLAVPAELGRFATQWLPAHFWITGAITWVTGDAVVSLVVVSLAAASAGIWLMDALTAELFGARAGWLASLLLAFLTLYLWLGVSHTEYPLYFACLLGSTWQLAVWLRTGRHRALLASSLLMLGAMLFRIEGWTFAACFAVAVAAGARLRREPILSPRILGAIAIPFLFVLPWMGITFSTFGNPVESLAVNRAQMVDSTIAVTDMPVWARALKLPGMLALTSPSLCLAIAVWIALCWREIRGRLAIFLGIVGGYALALGAAYVAGFDTEAEPRRYPLVALVLLTPLAGALLDRLVSSARPRTRRLAVAGLVLYAGANVAYAQLFPTVHRDAVATGRHLAAQLEAGAIPAGQQIATDWVLRRLLDAPYENHGAFIVGTSDHAGVAGYSRHPTRFVQDVRRDRYEQAGHLPPPDELRARLSDLLPAIPICKVAVRDRRLAAALPDRFELEAWFGSHVLFSAEPCRPARTWEAPIVARRVPVGREVADGITLEGYSYDAGLLPQAVTLIWRIDPGTGPIPPLAMEIAFRLDAEAEPRHRETVDALVGWGERAGQAFRMQDTIPIRLPPDTPSGRYALTVAAPAGATPIPLGRVPLVESKRQVLLDLLNARPVDWSVLWRTIATL